MTATKAKKEAILKDKANLPGKSQELPGKPPGGAPGKPEAIPSGENVVIPGKTLVLPEIKPTGLGQRAICGIYDFALRAGGPPLRSQERELFKEPADKLEVEVMRLLPEWLKDLSDKYGPLTDAALGIVTAFYLIRQMRGQEFACASAKSPAKDPIPAAAQEKPKETPGPGEIKVNLN